MRSTALRLLAIITFFCFSAAAFAANSGYGAGIIRPIKQQEITLNARIGAAVLNPDGRVILSYRGNERFPLNSTHKAFLCAALLHKADRGALNLADRISISKADIVAYSPITEKYIYPKTVNWRQLCSAAMRYSDNTAANLISAELGGPAFVTQFFRSLGDGVTQLNRYEPALNTVLSGDRRDTTAPLAAARDLRLLLFGNILQAQSRRDLRQWMRGDAVAGDLLRKTLPQGWIIADKSGAGEAGGYGSRSIIAAVWPKGRDRPWIIAVYLTEAKAPAEQRNKAIAQIGAAIFGVIERAVR